MCQSVPSVKDERVGAILDWAKWVAQILVIPFLGAILTTLLAVTVYVENRMDRLELGQQSRFTASDGLAVWEAINEQQHEFAVLVERLNNHLASTVPANELVKVVDYSSDKTALERRLTKLETKGGN